jgi:hypothetical protein
MAVGYSLTDRGIGGTLVESWDGKSWSVVPSPHNAPAVGSAALAGVSCASAKACVAVGAHGAISGAFRTLIESWDGKSWSVVPSPDGRPLGGSFYGVSCRSRTCTAVGSRSGKTGASGTLIESWDGNSWSVVTSPNNGTTSGHNVLYGVFCASRGSCVAVGYTSTTGVDRTLIESWDGKSWSVVPSPNSVSSPLRTVDRGFKNFSLYGVSCASLIVCGAVGSVGDGGAKSEPLVEMS